MSGAGSHEAPTVGVRALAEAAKRASRRLARLNGDVRARALAAMPAALESARERLLAANRRDLGEARLAGLSEPLLKRLAITDKVFTYMQNRLEEVAARPDPIGKVLAGQTRPNGLRVMKVSVPLGVIGIVYESRPNVTTDAASVCLKSANAVILRGGSEALRSNQVLAEAMAAAASGEGLPAEAVQLVPIPGREAVAELLTLDDCIDLIIPRGGKGLVERVVRESRIPVIKHDEGICHLYLADDAPTAMAVALSVNSKCQRVEVCNAMETLLVDAASAARLLPPLGVAFAEQGVELRGCDRTRACLPQALPATDDDWATEYLAPILSIRVVDGLDAAIDHINTWGSGHTDGIVTASLRQAQAFVDGVDSGSVLVNASTRLSGGGDYGMGAVVGISTNKLHARGPVGPDELTTYKWVAFGDGHLRD